MDVFLDRYGLRCVDELKLEQRSFRDRPHLVYQLIRNYRSLDDPIVLDANAKEASERQLRGETEQRAWRELAKSSSWLPRRRIFRWVLENTRLGVRNRENMRFARTRIYGILRSMLSAIGEHLEREGILEADQDISYLTMDEVWDFIKGTAVTTDLRGLVGLRQREYERYRDGTLLPPDSRFETYGLAYHQSSLRGAQCQGVDTPAHRLQGIGCCPGIVTGKVQVVHDPTDGARLDGDILVAERTDPGWVRLYPAFSGMLVERGSVLSHSAIVAREFGIPTIVSVDGLTRHLTSGQLVRMDGRTGQIEIVGANVGQ